MSQTAGHPAEATAAFNTRKTLSLQNLAAGMIGNALEWYDFGLYGYLAPVIGSLFFPSSNPTASLLSAYGGFAIGFVMRPVGGAVFGHLGDRMGRRAVLIASVVLMGCATTTVGLLPTYAEIGIWAPILLLILRMFQGFSVGGEFTSSVSFLVETAPRSRRGLAGGFSNIGSTGGYLLASGMAALTVMYAGQDHHYNWIWRVPFLGGGVLAVCAYAVRSRLTDTGYKPEKPAMDEKREPPLMQAFRHSPRAITLAVIFTWGYGIANYLTMVFLPTFASRFGRISGDHALQITTIGEAVAVLVIPLAGWLTDFAIRRRSMLIIAFGLIFVASLGFFALAKGGGLAGFWVAQLGFAAFLAMVMGAAPAMLVELFRSEYRLSGYSLAFNVGLGFGGGTAPLIATGLIGLTGHRLSAAVYLMVGAAMSIGALFLMKDRSRENLL